jgi:hypothetical protein
MPRCVHCRHGQQSRPRGLCWTCFRCPQIRELYPSTSKFASRGFGHSGYKGPPPDPTWAAPGSIEKQAVLRSRAAAGYDLHHPGDSDFAA